MKPTLLENLFVLTMCCLIGLVLTFVAAPAEAHPTTCENAHTTACEDLIGAEVFFEKVGKTAYEEVCGAGTDACAVLKVNAKQCTIYYNTRFLSKKTLTHEMNHCRGWFHKANRATQYNRPWVDLATYLGD